MFDARAYLEALGFPERPEPTLETLTQLHKNHLIQFPYRAGELIALSPNLADIDLDSTFAHVVRDREGGVCFDLNGLFRALLADLGYEVIRIAASVNTGRVYSPERSHLLTGVLLDGERLLADVGFSGPSFLTPLRMTAGPQDSHGVTFEITTDGDTNTLRRKAKTGPWVDMYHFRFADRPLAEWDGFTSVFEDFFRSSVFAGTTVCCRGTETGHVMLVGKRYLEVDAGTEKVRALMDPDEYARTLAYVQGRTPQPSS